MGEKKEYVWKRSKKKKRGGKSDLSLKYIVR